MLSVLFIEVNNLPRKNPETKFKEKVQDDLDTLNSIWYLKTQEVSVRGVPDILMCLKGILIAIELKVDSKLSELQIYNLRKIKKAGGKSYVATPDNWKEIFQELKELA